LILDAEAIAKTLAEMADRIVEVAGRESDLLLVGIQRRGVELANRLATLVEARTGQAVARGKLDITLYRDDLQAIGPRPVVGVTSLPASLDDAIVVIVDDVLFTGRTIRAALDEVADFGRPRRILLCVLVDRGGRELPIQADIIGIEVETAPGDHVNVRVRERDGEDAVELVRAGAG
jgi:pyrimidine operon attenuation protein/uracil phosphoribosyltransferase